MTAGPQPVRVGEVAEVIPTAHPVRRRPFLGDRGVRHEAAEVGHAECLVHERQPNAGDDEFDAARIRMCRHCIARTRATNARLNSTSSGRTSQPSRARTPVAAEGSAPGTRPSARIQRLAPSHANVRPVSRPLVAKIHIGRIATNTSTPNGTAKASSTVAMARRRAPLIASHNTTSDSASPRTTAIHSSRNGAARSATLRIGDPQRTGERLDAFARVEHRAVADANLTHDPQVDEAVVDHHTMRPRSRRRTRRTGSRGQRSGADAANGRSSPPPDCGPAHAPPRRRVLPGTVRANHRWHASSTGTCARTGLRRGSRPNSQGLKKRFPLLSCQRRASAKP